MIIAAHQPHFLPWAGYFNKVANSAVFVWLDTVQYRKNYFQNRTRIMDSSGREQWLTLPVSARSTTSIAEVTIADPRWRTQVEKTLLQCYRKAAHWEEVWPPLHAALLHSDDRLSNANLALFLAMLNLLEWREVQIVRASSLDVDTSDPTERLITICRRLGASRYIAGKGGRNYMCPEQFAAAGIEVVWQEFEPSRAAYERPGVTGMVAGLSLIDALFHLGPERTAIVARSAWTAPSQ